MKATLVLCVCMCMHGKRAFVLTVSVRVHRSRISWTQRTHVWKRSIAFILRHYQSASQIRFKDCLLRCEALWIIHSIERMLHMGFQTNRTYKYSSVIGWGTSVCVIVGLRNLATHAYISTHLIMHYLFVFTPILML